MATKKVTVSPKRSAVGPTKSPAKGRSIGQNLKLTGKRVANAISQNADNISSGGMR